MARRYVNPTRISPELEARVAAQFSLGRGEVDETAIAAYLAIHAPQAAARRTEVRQEAARAAGKGPGAVLDKYPWGNSWHAFFKALRTDNSARVAIRNAAAAMSERVPSEGGFLLSEALRAEVYMYAEQALVRPRAQVIPMSTYRLNLPVIDNPDQASGAGVLGGMTFSIVKEGKPIPASIAGLSRVTFEARKLAGLLEDVSNELIDDGGPAFDSFIGPAVGRGVAWTEDDLFLNGTGVGEPEGLLNAPCAIYVNRATSNTVSLVDVANMWTRLAAPSMQAGTAIWLCSTAVVEALATLDQDVSGTIIPASPFMLGTGSDGGWRLGGLPLFVTDHVAAMGSTGDLALVDFGWYGIGDRQALEVTRAQLGEGFANDTSDIKVTARLDGRWLVREPVTPSNGNQTTSPVVLLDAST